MPWCPPNETPRSRFEGDNQDHISRIPQPSEESKVGRRWNCLGSDGTNEAAGSWNSEAYSGGQCPGPRDQGDGEKVSMSQRGPAPRPPSRRSSKSPTREARPPTSQLGTRNRDDALLESPHDPGDPFNAHVGGRTSHVSGRTTDVHNILNPPEAHVTYPVAPGPSSHRGVEPGSSPSSIGASQYSQRASPSHPFSGPVQAHQSLPPGFGPAPGGPVPPGPPPPAERGPSPTSGQIYSPIGAGRRILTPKSRVASLSRGVVPRSAEQPPPLPFPSHPQPRVSQNEATSYPGAPSQTMPSQFPASHPAQASIAPNTAPPIATPPRSLSQPLMGNLQHPELSQQAQQSGYDMGRRTPSYPAGTSFVPGLPQGRGLTNTGPSGDGRWSAALMSSIQSGSTSSRGMALEQGQHVITITPSYGEEIHVPVDIHQASKQADEKRQRNAGASARFRLRKKEKEKEVIHGLQRLEQAEREYVKQIQDLRAERDHYRNERNRLRDIVYRTPSIRELADQGPPSPTSTRSGGSLGGSLGGSFATESGNLGFAPVPPGHPPPFTSGDPSMERPTRRRRTDPAPEFTTPTYGTPIQMPSTLPPITQSAYGLTTPSPHPSASPGSARLPPLRLDQPGVSPTSENPPLPGGPPPQLPLPSGQYTHYGRAPHETGWATGPRTHRDLEPPR